MVRQPTLLAHGLGPWETGRPFLHVVDITPREFRARETVGGTRAGVAREGLSNASHRHLLRHLLLFYGLRSPARHVSKKFFGFLLGRRAGRGTDGD